MIIPQECDPLTKKDLARHYTDYAIPAHNTIHNRGTGINSSLLYRYKAVSSGLNISASCEHSNELSVGILFYLETPSFSRKILFGAGSWLWQFVVIHYTHSLPFITEPLF